MAHTCIILALREKEVQDEGPRAARMAGQREVLLVPPHLADAGLVADKLSEALLARRAAPLLHEPPPDARDMIHMPASELQDPLVVVAVAAPRAAGGAETGKADPAPRGAALGVEAVHLCRGHAAAKLGDLAEVVVLVEGVGQGQHSRAGHREVQEQRPRRDLRSVQVQDGGDPVAHSGRSAGDGAAHLQEVQVLHPHAAREPDLLRRRRRLEPTRQQSLAIRPLHEDALLRRGEAAGLLADEAEGRPAPREAPRPGRSVAAECQGEPGCRALAPEVLQCPLSSGALHESHLSRRASAHVHLSQAVRLRQR
mmetsp:Transcript_132602/g.383320  ORF Transcript_132602/g.383320 Transcript_132602/m.383320 type:complete len:311 (+) Transcript_132602:387-1319(+)